MKDTEKIMILIEDTQRRDETDKNVFLRVLMPHICVILIPAPKPNNFLCLWHKTIYIIVCYTHIHTLTFVDYNVFSKKMRMT